jgi:hypothetical protein
MTNRELADKARGVGRCLTYNDDAPQAKAKHLLLEMAHRLDLADVRARYVGLQLRDGLGRERRATWRECLAYWLTGALPPRL